MAAGGVIAENIPTGSRKRKRIPDNDIDIDEGDRCRAKDIDARTYQIVSLRLSAPPLMTCFMSKSDGSQGDTKVCQPEAEWPGVVWLRRSPNLAVGFGLVGEKEKRTTKEYISSGTMDFMPLEPILPSLSDVVRWQGSQTACPALDSLILESEITVRPTRNNTPRVSLFAEAPLASSSITPANTTRSSSRLRPRHSEPAAPPPTTSFLNPRLDIFEENGPTKFLNFVKVVSARVDENVNANAANGSGKKSSKRKQRSVSVSSLTAAGMLKKGRTDPMTVQPSSSLRNEVGWKGKSRALIRSASATTSGYDDDDYSLMDVDMSFGSGMDVDVPQAFFPPPQTKSASQIDMPPPPAPPVKPKLWGAESGELRMTRSSVVSSSTTTKPSPSVTGVASASSSSRMNTSSSSTSQASSSTARPTSSSSTARPTSSSSTNYPTTSLLTRAGTWSSNSNSNSNSSSRTTTSLPPATPKSATVLPPPRTPTKSGLRSSSPRPSKTSAKGPNPNSNAVPSNEKGAPIQTRPPVQVQTRAAPAPAQTRPQPQVQTRPTGQTHIPPPSRPSPPIPPPSSSQRPPSSQHPPALGMRRTHTLPLPPASQSGELPSRQRRFKPPLLGAHGNQGALLSGSQGARNGVVGGGVKNNGPSVGGAPVTVTSRNAPPAPAPPPSSFPSSSSGDSPQRCGGYRSSPSSADDSDVCVTPGVPPKPNCSSVTSKPIASKSNSKCAQPDENDDASLLMVEDDPNDSSFGDIDMSFDMDALEETMKILTQGVVGLDNFSLAGRCRLVALSLAKSEPDHTHFVIPAIPILRAINVLPHLFISRTCTHHL
ncbi:uncharacterized protein LACBIDRAFT_328929 [Laccaria bicolor S238N-H82]|uniref:Predicted protein n=1 Tax=Laccaria bicolor (strain S238N-H82 / ATCC MYA-4686) TaxID=486041 RepID=B0DGG8_LACBS|nr:uncharacterized protein LACBIDRAFT_328929 [Laccaria bicolor S238N-H82]EDR06153.1 predicted protein [Laccaria bicolor S238N-H82]|eukprot:XP_001883014.1 predicted protein [Laccaria bicolor S238N-H82]